MADWSQFWSFINGCAIYYALQLVRCVIFSFALIGLVMLLRRTLFSKLIFAKGMLWALFLLIPFLGKMKLFYENVLVVKATGWMTGSIMTYTWIAHIYMAGIWISFFYIFGKRIRLQRIVSRMKKQFLGGKLIFITDMNVTPFTVGLIRPKIVLPKVMVDSYSGEEIEAIIRHEQMHIRLGHLWCYFAWDILRCLLWLNPFLTFYQRYFRADMEDMCDRVCIQNSGKTAQEYGQLLLKTLKLLRTEQNNISSVVTYAGEKDFEDIKRRMGKIAHFRSYRKVLCRSMAFVAAALLCIAFVGIGSISYARCNELDDILVYEYNPENGNAVVLDSSNRMQQMISYDDDYVYVDRAAFETFLSEKNAGREIYIVFGGFQKLPGIGGGGESCLYQVNSDERIVMLPYEKAKDSWSMALFKML